MGYLFFLWFVSFACVLTLSSICEIRPGLYVLFSSICAQCITASITSKQKIIFFSYNSYSFCCCFCILFVLIFKVFFLKNFHSVPYKFQFNIKVISPLSYLRPEDLFVDASFIIFFFHCPPSGFMNLIRLSWI